MFIISHKPSSYEIIDKIEVNLAPCLFNLVEQLIFVFDRVWQHLDNIQKQIENPNV